MLAAFNFLELGTAIKVSYLIVVIALVNIYGLHEPSERFAQPRSSKMQIEQGLPQVKVSGVLRASPQQIINLLVEPDLRRTWDYSIKSMARVDEFSVKISREGEEDIPSQYQLMPFKEGDRIVICEQSTALTHFFSLTPLSKRAHCYQLVYYSHALT